MSKKSYRKNLLDLNKNDSNTQKSHIKMLMIVEDSYKT